MFESCKSDAPNVPCQMFAPRKAQLTRREIRAKEALALFLLGRSIVIAVSAVIVRITTSLVVVHIHILRPSRLLRIVRVAPSQGRVSVKLLLRVLLRERRRRIWQRLLASHSAKAVPGGSLYRLVVGAGVGRGIQILVMLLLVKGLVRTGSRGSVLLARLARRRLGHGQGGVYGAKARHGQVLEGCGVGRLLLPQVRGRESCQRGELTVKRQVLLASFGDTSLLRPTSQKPGPRVCLARSGGGCSQVVVRLAAASDEAEGSSAAETVRAVI